MLDIIRHILKTNYISMIIKEVKKYFKQPMFDKKTLLAIFLFFSFVCWSVYTIKLFAWEYISPFIINDFTLGFCNDLKKILIAGKIYFILAFICFLISLFIHSVKKDIQNQLSQLDKIKNKMSELVNPALMYSRLSEDIIRLECAENLVPMFENNEIDSVGFPLICGLRAYFSQNYGFVFQNIHVLDECTLKDSEFVISIQGDKVFRGNTIDDKKLSFKLEAKLPSSENKYKKQTIKMIDDLGDCIIEHIKSIMTKRDVELLISYAKYIHDSDIYDLVLTKFSIEDLREIFTNLIREKVSIRNYAYIFEKIYKYSEFYKTQDEISERLRIDLLKQSTIVFGYEKSNLNTIEMNDELEDFLKKSIQIRENSKVIDLEKTNYEKLKQTILNLFKEHCEKEPVILCSKEIRLPLFRLFSKYVPHISVYAKEELAKNIKLENIAEIKI